CNLAGSLPLFRHGRACPGRCNHLRSFPRKRESSAVSRCRDIGPKITPVRIRLLNQRKLPPPAPLLELAFAPERRFSRLVKLEPDQHFHAMATCKAWGEAVAVLPNALHQVVRHPSIESAVSPACENVNREGHANSALGQLTAEKIRHLQDVSPGSPLSASRSRATADSTPPKHA